ncbi:hypothetical protein QVD17_30422 [Tagetes erecta]|uniref:Uncharacterized protein n=1 Tax=Tagetes erecta TaxID=13708 RepID=A0AAD8K5L7_TARER|nr:hypothetical protein QVD17_30422 [Tagetes erecta]
MSSSKSSTIMTGLSVGKSDGLISLYDPTIFQTKRIVKDRNFMLLMGNVHGCDEDILIRNVYAPQAQSEKLLF